MFLGLGLLLGGGDVLLRGATGLAERFKISPAIIGAVIIGFGTSMPELMISVQSSFKGVPAIAFGNVVGSNIANTLLILGVAGVLRPVLCNGAEVRRDAWFLTAASLVLWVYGCFFSTITQICGGLMLALLAGYLAYSYKKDQQQRPKPAAHDVVEAVSDAHPAHPTWLALLFCMVGIVGLVFGAKFLVDAASTMARSWGISEAVIGLTLVAIGTSLPELAATVVSAWRNHTEMIIGNILGSGFFNILAILGTTAVITPLPIDAHIQATDLPFMLVVTLALLGIILWRKKIERTTGIIFLGFYAAYMWWLFV
jgi:cation:H+ antiporter